MPSSMYGPQNEVIRSGDNPVAKRIRSLRQRSTRESERAFVVEGVRAVEDALETGAVADILLIRSDFEWTPRSSDSVRAIRYVNPKVFDTLSETTSPQPLLAVFSLPDLSPQVGAVPFVLVADGIRDPGNLGTLLRSAAAAGVNLVLLTPGTVDPYNGKVVRAAMGAHFRIPIHLFDEDWNRWILGACPHRVLADAEGKLEYTDANLKGAVVVIVGSEAEGATAAGLALATQSVRIDLENGVESLNAGIAGSIILFEAHRQRRS